MFERIKSLILRPRGNRRVRAARPSSPASIRLEMLRLWIVWLMAAVALGASVAALSSFSSVDPAWSTSGAAGGSQKIRNWLGSVGAWCSDIAYFALGASIGWLVLFAALTLWRDSPAK